MRHEHRRSQRWTHLFVSNFDPGNSQWPAVTRTGFLYTVTDWLDVDAGFQARLNRSATRAVRLAGALVAGVFIRGFGAAPSS